MKRIINKEIYNQGRVDALLWAAKYLKESPVESPWNPHLGKQHAAKFFEEKAKRLFYRSKKVSLGCKYKI